MSNKVCPLMTTGFTYRNCIEDKCMLWSEQFANCDLKAKLYSTALPPLGPKQSAEPYTTNADYIRSMTDEEMLDEMRDLENGIFDICAICPLGNLHEDGECEESDEQCEKYCLDWLKAPRITPDADTD